MTKNNPPGVKFVGDTWLAQIAYKGRVYKLGRFQNYEDAVAARESAEKLRVYDSPVRGVIADLSGQSFGRLIARKLLPNRDKHGNAVWRCECECGNFKDVPADDLKSGYIRSCGCLLKESRSANYKAHRGTAKKGKFDGIAGVYQTSNGKFALSRMIDLEIFNFGVFDNLEKIKKVSADIEGMDYAELLDYFVGNFPNRWESFKKSNGHVGIKKRKNKYMVEVRKKNHRFYVGLRDEVGAYKLRNFANNMNWKEFSAWYAEKFPDAWERYQKQESAKAIKFKFELSLHNDKDAELIKQLNYSGDINVVLKAALEAYLIPPETGEKNRRAKLKDTFKLESKTKSK